MIRVLLAAVLLLPLSVFANATNCGNWGPPEICDANGHLQQSYLDNLMSPPDWRWITDQIDFESDLGDQIVRTRTFFMTNPFGENSADECTQTCDTFVPPPVPSLYECGDWEPGLICDLNGKIHDAVIAQKAIEGFTLDKVDDYTYETAIGMIHRKDFVFGHENGYLMTVKSCGRNCPLVDSCSNPGETQGPLGICSATADGPYLPGKWVGSGSCHPDDGSLVWAYANALAEKHWVLAETRRWTTKFVDRGQVNSWIERRFAHTKGGSDLTEICNQAAFYIDVCPVNQVPDAIGLCEKERHTTPGQVGGSNRVFQSESGTYRRFSDVAEGMAMQAESQGDSALEYGAVIYRDVVFGYKYSNVIEKTPGSILFTKSLADTVDELESQGHRVYGYAHTINSNVLRDEDRSYAQFLKSAFGLSYFYASTPDGNLTRYR